MPTSAGPPPRRCRPSSGAPDRRRSGASGRAGSWSATTCRSGGRRSTSRSSSRSPCTSTSASSTATSWPTRRAAVGSPWPADGMSGHAYLKLEPAAATMPDVSVFGSRAEAQSFLVDRFVAFVPGVGNDPMRRVRVRRGTWDVLLPSAMDVRSDILDGCSDFPAGTTLLDNVFVARDIPNHWYAAEVERSPGQWRRPRLSLPDRSSENPATSIGQPPRRPARGRSRSNGARTRLRDAPGPVGACAVAQADRGPVDG